MKGVRFGNYHSYDDWGLVLQKKEIGAPEPKVNQIEIEGGDGVLDLTEFFGEVKYKNRSLSFTFAKPGITQSAFFALYSVVQGAIHGQKMQVIIDDDSSSYYYGRITINEWKSNKNIGEIVIEVDAEPYKYNLTETVVSKAVSGSATITLPNSRKRAVPTITTTASMSFTFGSSTYSVNAGTFIIPDLELVEGNNSVVVSGNGTVSFRYREGKL